MVRCAVFAAVALVVLGLGPTVVYAQTPMEIDITSIDFGTLNVGNTSAGMAVTLTNTDPVSSFGPINIFGGAPSIPEFSATQNCQGATLAAGASCTVTYTFSPSAATTFNDSSDFVLSDTADPADGENFSVSLTGVGVNPIVASPLDHDFGSINVGNTSGQLATLVVNTSDDPFGPITIFGGAPSLAEFSATQNCQGATLTPGGSCSVLYTFSPTAPATFDGVSNFTISAGSASAGEAFSIDLTGVGVNPIIAFPLSHDFGDVNVSTTSAARSTTILNTSSDPFGPITIFGGAPSIAEFSATQNCQGATLAPSGTCMVNYTFTPSATGTFSGASNFTISAASASAGEDFSVDLLGCGVNPGEPCPSSPTTTALTCAPNPSTMGQAVLCTATVTSPAAGIPTGTVMFTVDAAPLATTVLDAGGQATTSTTTLASGTHSIIADYVPDTPDFMSSSSAPFSQDVVAPVPLLPGWWSLILALLLVAIGAGLLAARLRGSPTA